MIFSLALGKTFKLSTLPLFYWFCKEHPLTCHRPLTKCPFVLLHPPPRHLEKCCKAVTLLRLHCLLSRSWRRQRGRCPVSRGAGKQEFPFRDWLQRITWLLRNMRLTTAHFPLPSHIHLSRGHKSAWWKTQDGWSAGWDAGSPHRVTTQGHRAGQVADRGEGMFSAPQAVWTPFGLQGKVSHCWVSAARVRVNHGAPQPHRLCQDFSFDDNQLRECS